MKWPARLSIAKGVARAMAYLHHSAKPTTPTMIPHGNLKPSNVLLDDKDAALVTDHGFSSLISTTIASQRMAAYKSPEYLHLRKVCPKSDVWCFGSLMLEILVGRVSALSAPAGVDRYDLYSWVYRAVREEWTAEIFDVEIAERKRASAGMLNLLKVALRCCEKQPEKRPEMGEVAREVEEIKSGSEEVEDEVSDESWPSFGTAEEELGSMSDP